MTDEQMLLAGVIFASFCTVAISLIAGSYFERARDRPSCIVEKTEEVKKMKTDNIKLLISQAGQNYDYWCKVRLIGNYAQHNKTPEDVDALINYFEGRYDLGVALRHLVE